MYQVGISRRVHKRSSYRTPLSQFQWVRETANDTQHENNIYTSLWNWLPFSFCGLTYLITASPFLVRMPNWNIWSTIWMRMNDPLPSLYWDANNSKPDTESTLKVTVKSNFSIARRNCVQYSMYDVPANLHCVCRGTGSASEKCVTISCIYTWVKPGGGSDKPPFCVKSPVFIELSADLKLI